VDSVIEGRVRAFWEQAFNGRALDLIAAITAPGFVNHNALPGTPPGPEGHRQVLERCASSTADNGQDQGRLMSRVRPAATARRSDVLALVGVARTEVVGE